jgi:hypothetical protein
VSDFIATFPEDNQLLAFLGFSLGAMIALIATTRIAVDNLILCSPSGYFAEYDIALTKKIERGLMKISGTSENFLQRIPLLM